MLSELQFSVLRLLNELNSSSLDDSDQQARVTTINEMLQQIKDQAEYEQLIAPTASQSSDITFIDICRRRLIGAQQDSGAHYKTLRSSKTKQIIDSTSQGDAVDTSVAEEGSDPADLAQSLQETKSEDITQVLQRMHEMAQGEILKGELNISELDMSSRTLRELQEKYSGVDILLNGSKRLVKVLDEADKWDRRCMLASLGFLAFVMCYIVYRRILSGPLKVLVWSLLKLFGIAKLFTPKNSSPVQTGPAGSGLASSTTTNVELPVTPRIGGVQHTVSFVPHNYVHSEL